jgi:hypothetical protein
MPNESPILLALAVLSNVSPARIFVISKLGADEKLNEPQMLGNGAQWRVATFF